MIITISLYMANQTERHHNFTINDGEIVAGYEIRVDGDPVVRQSFAIHDDTGRYHTICRRRKSGVSEVAW